MAIKTLKSIPRWKKLQLRHAKARSRVNILNARSGSHGRLRFRKGQFIKAIAGTNGNISEIAQKLKCHRTTIENYLSRPGWEIVLKRYGEEVSNGIDALEKSLVSLAISAEDESVRANSCKWLLERLRKDKFLIDKRVVLEGGRNPIKTQNQNVNLGVDISTLNLPIEVKRQLLQALDQQDGTEGFIQEAAQLPVVPAIVDAEVVDETDETEDQEQESEAEEQIKISGEDQADGSVRQGPTS